MVIGRGKFRRYKKIFYSLEFTLAHNHFMKFHWARMGKYTPHQFSWSK
jgi:hypothetical protein